MVEELVEENFTITTVRVSLGEGLPKGISVSVIGECESVYIYKGRGAGRGRGRSSEDVGRLRSINYYQGP